MGFRYTVVTLANDFPHVSGTVRNLRNGAVEVDAEGEEEDVKAFIDAVIRKPPFSARVDRVDRREAPPRGLSGFGAAPNA